MKPIIDSLKGYLNNIYGTADYIMNTNSQNIYLDRVLIEKKNINLRDIPGTMCTICYWI
ncbi:MAG: hypothetical protein IPP27_08330 [Bacteroidetes bacterium]|nr:hypothetical protein [Bacteroidota bacterium]